MNDLVVYCCFCNQQLIKETNKNKPDLLLCRNRFIDREAHLNDDEVWAWIEHKAVNIRINSEQLLFQMSSSTTASKVYFVTPDHGFSDRAILAEDLEIDFSKYQTVADVQRLLILLKAFG